MLLGYKDGHEEGIKEGMKEGVEKGIKQGFKEGILTTAINLLANGIDIDFISKITGLSADEIQELKENNISK